MDPLSLITGALLKAVADLANPMVKDAYEEVKSLLKRKFDGNSAGQLAVDKLESNPKAWEPALKDEMAKAKLHEDGEVTTVVNKLIQTMRESSGGSGSETYTAQTMQV